MVVVAALALAFSAGACKSKAKEKLAGAEADVAKTQAKQLAADAYTRWRMESGKDCPSSVDELMKYTNMKNAKDPWGNDYQTSCEGGFTVTSNGPDGKPGTGDDISASSR